MAYVSNETGQDQIWVRPFPEAGAGSRRVSTGLSAVEPLWSGDGRELFFRSGGRTVALQVLDPETFTTGEVRTLFPNEELLYYTDHRRHDYDGAGHRFLMMRRPAVEEAPPS